MKRVNCKKVQSILSHGTSFQFPNKACTILGSPARAASLKILPACATWSLTIQPNLHDRGQLSSPFLISLNHEDLAERQRLATEYSHSPQSALLEKARLSYPLAP